MLGGGGYDGTVPNVVGNVPAGPDRQPQPGRIAATRCSAATRATPAPATRDAFALNDEALRNFASDALKKTRDAAIVPGRQALRHGAAAQLLRRRLHRRARGAWPSRRSGRRTSTARSCSTPAWNAASLDLQFGRITRALAAPGAYPSLAKRKALYRRRPAGLRRQRRRGRRPDQRPGVVQRLVRPRHRHAERPRRCAAPVAPTPATTACPTPRSAPSRSSTHPSSSTTRWPAAKTSTQVSTPGGPTSAGPAPPTRSSR